MYVTNINKKDKVYTIIYTNKVDFVSVKSIFLE